MERLWNSNYKKVMFANFALFFSFYLLAPLLPIYLSENFSASKDVIGFVLSGYTITALLFRPLSGYLVDSFDRKKILMSFYFFFFIFFSGYIVAGSLLLFAIVRTLHGGPFGGLTVANSTAAIDVLPPIRRNEGIGYYGLSNNLAMAIAPTIGIMIFEKTGNFTILFWIALVVAGVGMFIDQSVSLPKNEVQKNMKSLSFEHFFLVRGWLLALNVIFVGFCFGVLQNYLAIYSKETMGITGGTGLFFLLLSIGLIVSRIQGSKSLRKGKLTRHAILGLSFSTVGYCLFVLCPNEVGYYVSPLLIGLGNGHIWPAFLNMMINVAGNDQRGTANSTLLVSWDVGVGIGVLLGGVLAESISYLAAFYAVAITQVASFLLFIMATKQFFLKKKVR